MRRNGVRRPIALEISEVRWKDREKGEWEVASCKRGEEKKRRGS